MVDVGWRVLLERRARVDGMLGAGAELDLAHFLSGAKANAPRHGTTVPGLGKVETVVTVSDDGTPLRGCKVDGLAAMARDADGRPIGWLRAAVVRPEPGASWAGEDDGRGLLDLLVDATDESWHARPEDMGALAREGRLARAFGGGALMVLDVLVRDRGATAKGDGARLLAIALAAYARSRRTVRIGAIAYDPVPMQFDEADAAGRTAAFREGSRALRAHLDQLVVRSASRRADGRPMEPIAFTRPTDDGPDAGILELAAMHERHDPARAAEGRTAEGVRERAIRLTAVSITMAGGVPARTFPRDEPTPLDPDAYPAGFDPYVATLFPRVSPHPALWRHMPSELVAITVLPTGRWEVGKPGFGRRGPDGTTRGRPEVILKLHFANGSELDFPSRAMVFGVEAGGVLPELLAAGGSIVAENPYAPRMRTLAMQDALAVNLCMVFSGRVENGVAEIEEATFRRPGPGRP